MELLEHKNYRTYLKNVLAERAKENPRYSLRAFAQKLNLAPSYLSSILSGQKNPSPARALALAAKLGLNSEEQEYFCLLVQIDSTRDPELKSSFLKRARILNPKVDVQNLTLDHFRVISDWQHFAIMAATEMTQFHPTAAEFSRALGISRLEVDLALDRLLRLEMLELDERGRYKKTKSNPRVVSVSPNAALRRYHQQTLAKATESLETQTPQEKVVGSETFTIDSSQLGEFRKLTDQFFEDALALAKKSKKKDHVYHLGVQFFNFTQNKNKGKVR